MYHSTVVRSWLALVTLAFVLVASQVPAVGADSLSMPVSYAVGDEPWSVAVAHLNGDANLDLAVTNRGDNTVTILYGNGDGAFGDAVHHPVGSDPWNVAAADLNGDGYVDLAVANYEDNSISLLFGGPAGFGAPIEYSLGDGGTPVAVAASDVDGDSMPDLVVADSSNDKVAILINDGDGTFATAVHYEVTGYPISLVVGDFDGSNGDDIAVACTDDNVVSVLLNTGDGTFAAAVNYAAGSRPVWVAAGDFDDDGDVDLAVANVEGDSISILLNQGNGAFVLASEIDMGTGATPAGVVAGLFDADDSYVDLAVANHNTKSVTLLAGDGEGGFTTTGDFSVGQFPAALGTGDFDSDGRSDVVVVNYGANSVSVMLSADLDVLTVELQAGWNLVSVPLTLTDAGVDEVFPRAIVYTWNLDSKSYSEPSAIEPNKAYWVRVVEPETVSLRGTAEASISKTLVAGWNMVGSVYGGPIDVEDLIDDEPGMLERNAIYRWDPLLKSYIVADTIEAGRGYWVAASENCTLSFGMG